MSDTGKRTNARAASVSTTDAGGGTRGDYPRMDTTKQAQTGHKTKQAQTGAAKVRRRPTEPPAAKPPAPGSSSATSGNQLTLVGATALVIGSIVGVGIFNLPSSLAPYGPITLISMGLTTIGALALARLFASLARRMPAPGGPYAYARVAFGNKLGFANAWSYWITAWAGNAAIAVGWVLYVEVFINKGQIKIWSILLVLVGLWVPAFINLSGLKNMGWFQLTTTITKFAALAFMSIVGLFYINTANFSPFNVSGHGAISAIGSGMAIALFSYLGLEVAAGRGGEGPGSGPEHPAGHDARHRRHSRRVHAVALRRLWHCLQFRPPEVHRSVLDRGQPMFGGTVWGNVMAVVVIISGIGALNGWTMICAEMPRAAAEDGVFPKALTGSTVAGRRPLESSCRPRSPRSP